MAYLAAACVWLTVGLVVRSWYRPIPRRETQDKLSQRKTLNLR